VHHPFGNTLAVEVRVFLEKLLILHQKRTAGAGCQRVLVVAHRDSGRGRELLLLHLLLLSFGSRDAAWEPAVEAALVAAGFVSRLAPRGLRRHPAQVPRKWMR